MRQPQPGLLGALALTALAGCAGTLPMHESQAELRDRYLAYAGEPITQFTWMGRYDSWEPLGANEVAVSTGIRDAYIIKVQSPCPRLEFATAIGLTSNAHTVNTGIDYVTFEQQRCPIAEIRRVDYQRFKADMRLEGQTRRAATQSP
jgi:hypothetical protein